MTIDNLTTIAALEAFMQGSQPVIFNVLGGKNERYSFIQKTLVKFRYITCSKREKGIIIQYLMKMTDYSRQQLTRLIKQYIQTGKVRWKPSTGNGFNKKYQQKDILLLAKMDEVHETPCGHAVKKLCERATKVFNDENYSTLADISVSHLYNLRSSKIYVNQRRHFTKTNPRQVPIGERKKPQPEGKPGYIRIDTVHQGDQDKVKGVYHINAVDEETQFEIVCSVERISEQYLMPILEQMLAAFPFKIINFHSDNGSEYINKPVLKLLNKLLINFTKSRSRHSNDNALAESKNASIVRKTLGYQHISQKWAGRINEFNTKFLNPHINFHRPCFFPETIIDDKGKQKKLYKYENMMTPYDKLKSLPNAEDYLKPEVNFSALDEFAMKMSDNESAELLQRERRKLFGDIFKQQEIA